MPRTRSQTNKPQPKIDVATAQKPARAPISADFKPKAAARSIRLATSEDAKVAGDWAVEQYPTVFEKLAK